MDPSASSPSTTRLTSIDVYRGFVMFLMMAEVLHLRTVASAHPGKWYWAFLARHQSHVEWIGCTLHDLIQPSFSFLVGVALPFSLASRTARGQSTFRLTLHAAWRALLLVLLGVFLRSLGRKQTYYTFEDTLSQIGLGYFFLFLLGLRPTRDQWIALGLILVGYWAAFAAYPRPASDFDVNAVISKKDQSTVMSGFAAHWNKNTNLAWAFDRYFLNLFPREKPFVANDGGYATLSFIPTLATMILGLIAGGVLRSPRTAASKIGWLVVAGVLSLGVGYGLGGLGICPVVKRIWTPSWVLFSGGWCLLILAGAYAVTDVLGWKRWAFPFMVIGMNSIAAYCMAGLIEGWVADNLKRHLGTSIFLALGPSYQPLLQGAAVLLVLWLILFGLYRKKVFLRI